MASLLLLFNVGIPCVTVQIIDEFQYALKSRIAHRIAAVQLSFIHKAYVSYSCTHIHMDGSNNITFFYVSLYRRIGFDVRPYLCSNYLEISHPADAHIQRTQVVSKAADDSTRKIQCKKKKKKDYSIIRVKRCQQ